MNFMTMMSSEVLVGRTDLAYGTRVPRKSWIFEGNPHYLYQRMVIHSARMAKPIMYYQYHATYHIFCARLALCMLMHVDTLYVHTHIHKITSRYLCIPVQIKYDMKNQNSEHHTHVYMYVCMSACMSACMYVCVVCMCGMYVWYVCVVCMVCMYKCMYVMYVLYVMYVMYVM